MFEGCHTILSSPFLFFFETVLFLVFYFFQIREVIEEEAEGVVVVGALCRGRLHCVTAGSRRKRGVEGSQETGGTEQGHSKEREGCVFTDLVRATPPNPTPP